MQSKLTPSDRQYRALKQVASVGVVVLVMVSMLALPVAADTDPCDDGPPVPPEPDDEPDEIEVALVNDRSSSMRGDRIDNLKTAATGFIDILADDDEAASISFNDEATVDQELTTDHEAVKQAIEDIDARAGTDYEDAVETGADELINGANANDGSNKTMVLVTDGIPESDSDESKSIDAAEAARDEGITIYAVGLGDNVDEEFLADVTGNSDQVYISPDSSELEDIYDEIGGKIQTAESDLTVETSNLFKPGDTDSYTVINRTVTSDGETIETDVTDEADLTSSNESVLSVNDDDATLAATGDNDVSTWVRLDAEYQGESGCTNVIVSEPTIDHAELLPGIWQYESAITDNVIYALLVILFAGIIATRFSNAFGGLSVMQLGVLVGWVGGWIPVGLAMVSVFLALFIGFNLAVNIDYTMQSYR